MLNLMLARGSAGECDVSCRLKQDRTWHVCFMENLPWLKETHRTLVPAALFPQMPL
jgi:hypothetical protein